jgi:diacylglycerol kinase
MTCKQQLDMRNFLISRGQAFRYAFEGWRYVLRTQPNVWIHALASLAVIGLAFWLQIDRQDWAVILLTIALVWMAEFLNTALEAVVDLASPSQHPLAKIAKDVGAAAVLIAAGSSVLVGMLILGPPLWSALQTWLTR